MYSHVFADSVRRTANSTYIYMYIFEFVYDCTEPCGRMPHTCCACCTYCYTGCTYILYHYRYYCTNVKQQGWATAAWGASLGNSCLVGHSGQQLPGGPVWTTAAWWASLGNSCLGGKSGQQLPGGSGWTTAAWWPGWTTAA